MPLRRTEAAPQGQEHRELETHGGKQKATIWTGSPLLIRKRLGTLHAVAEAELSAKGIPRISPLVEPLRCISMRRILDVESCDQSLKVHVDVAAL
eukprot:3332701-Pyramimonas_sp.AAC.1